MRRTTDTIGITARYALACSHSVLWKASNTLVEWSMGVEHSPPQAVYNDSKSQSDVGQIRNHYNTGGNPIYEDGTCHTKSILRAYTAVTRSMLTQFVVLESSTWCLRSLNSVVRKEVTEYATSAYASWKRNGSTWGRWLRFEFISPRPRSSVSAHIWTVCI